MHQGENGALVGTQGPGGDDVVIGGLFEPAAEATRQSARDTTDALHIEDPWEAIGAFFEATAARQAADRALHQALAGQGRAADKVRLWPDIVRAVTELFDRARRAGVLRADVEPEDAVVILSMLGAVDDRTLRPGARRRLGGHAEGDGAGTGYEGSRSRPTTRPGPAAPAAPGDRVVR